MQIDHPKVRALRFCLCGQPKDQGLVLCWPCHHPEKFMSNGERDYCAETIALLDRLEASEPSTMTKQIYVSPREYVLSLSRSIEHYRRARAGSEYLAYLYGLYGEALEALWIAQKFGFADKVPDQPPFLWRL